MSDDDRNTNLTYPNLTMIAVRSKNSPDKV